MAVVGSRSPTAGGRDNAHDFAAALARSGLAVASGLAAGIDTAAHEGALAAGGSTVAVLGTGPDVPYPARPTPPLQARIAATGAVVSEHPPGTPAAARAFPGRNRILAGLALGTLVIEAGRTLRRADHRAPGRRLPGARCSRVPGSIHNPLARGCHRLIRDGAGLVETRQEVIAALGRSRRELADALRGRLAAPTPSPDRATKRRSRPDDPDYQACGRRSATTQPVWIDWSRAPD